MGVNSEEHIKQQEENFSGGSNYESKLWYFYYQEEKEKSRNLIVKIKQLEGELKEISGESGIGNDHKA